METNETLARLESLEGRLNTVEARLMQIDAEHQKFLQALRDAAKEILSNSMTRVMMPEKMRKTLEQYVSLNDSQLAPSTAKPATAGA